MAKISRVWISVSNLERSLAFYTQKLGFIEKAVARKNDIELKGIISNSMAELTSTDGHSDIFLIENSSALPSTNAVIIGWEVPNLESARFNLEAKGIIFKEVKESAENQQLIHFTDPDGNLFQLFEMKK